MTQNCVLNHKVQFKAQNCGKSNYCRNYRTTCNFVGSKSRRGRVWTGYRVKVLQIFCKSGNSKNRDDPLKGVGDDTREAVSQVLEKAVRAADNWTQVTSDFLTPPECQDALTVLGKLSEVSGISWGGYGQAERKVIIAGREDVIDGLEENQLLDVIDDIVAIEVSGNFLFDPASHRDFLGACLGCGIERSYIGDILVQGERGAQIVVTKNMATFLQTTLQKVRSVPVEVKIIPLVDLKVPELKFKEIKSTEHSQRLDAIASSGFRVSRGAMADLIKAGDVKLNWRQVGKPSLDVNAGDVISCAGKGKINVINIEQNKKGKFYVLLQVLK